jgi:ABC-type antimicrobial peptide transport system permease subunit
LAEAQAVGQEIHQLDANQTIAHLRTMDHVIDEALSPQRTPMWLFGTFGGMALFLAGMGIYAVLSYYVLQRQQEIGTRIALGAQRRDVLRLVLGHAGKLITGGVALGLAGAFAASRALASLLFGVQPTDGPAFLGASLLLATLALIACGVPALRATQVDPLRVLRDE